MLKNLKWIAGHQTTASPSHGSGTGSGDPIFHGVGHAAHCADGKSNGLALAEEGGPDAKQFGMENFGNTCYANSVLQALYFCQPFRDLICLTPDPHATSAPVHPAATTLASSASSIQQPLASPQSRDELRLPGVSQPSLHSPIVPVHIPATLFSALRSLYLYISMHPQMKGTVQPTSFITKLKKENELFRSSMHQDAHEFLNYLLNKIVEDLEDNAKGREDLSRSLMSAHTSSGSSMGVSSHPNTLVQILFEGTLTNETRCLTCETVSSRDEAFLDLSIDIEQNSSVTACLKQFSASEMLCEKNKFFCDSCCGLQEAEKRMKIKRLPNVLALHLKRFKHNWDEDKYIKLGYRVAFPLELRLFNTADDAEDPDRLFQLFSFVVHIGGGPHQGHYITIVKSYGGVWRVFDDDTVSTILESDVPKYFGDTSTAAGYVLFYQAVDLDPEVIGLPPKPAPAVANGCATTTRSPLLLPEDSRASPSTQAHSINRLGTSGTPPNSHESATAAQGPSEIEAPLLSPHNLNKSASGVIKATELSVSSSNPSTSSQTGSTSFFRKKDGLSSEGGEPSPTRGPLHKEPSSLFSPPPHIGEKDKEKDHHRPSWFRTRRKDNLPPSSSISLLLQTATPNPDSAAVSPSSPLPSYHLHVVQRRQSSTNLLPIATVRTVPDSPRSSPSKRTSTTNPEVPPVPPLPMGVEPSPITSRDHLVVPPTPHHVMPATSQDPPGHRRRPSLSKSSITTFMKSRTSPGTLASDTTTSYPVMPTSPTPASRHKSPQQVNPVMSTSRSRPLSTGDPDSSQSDSAPIVNSGIVDGERLHSSTSTSRTSTIDPLPHCSETEAALVDLLDRSSMPPRPASPSVEKEKEREKDKVKTSGLTKRASKKMNLSSGLSIFGGWGSSSKDKDKRVHGTDGSHQLQLHDHRNDAHHHHEPPLMEEGEAFERTSGELERRERKRPGIFPPDVSSHFGNGLTEFWYGH